MPRASTSAKSRSSLSRRSTRTLDKIMADSARASAAMPATFNISQPISHAAERTHPEPASPPRSSSRSSATISTRCGRSPATSKARLARDARPCRRGDRAAGAGAADPGPGRSARGAPLRPSARRTVAHAGAPDQWRRRAQIVDGIKRFDRGDPARRWQRATAEQLSAHADRDAGRPGAAVAGRAVTETDGPNQVLRENSQRRIVVTANGDGTDMQHDRRSEVAGSMREIALPTGYFMRLEGVYAEQTRSHPAPRRARLVSLMLIFVILYSRYRSAVLALIIMGNVPLALIGSVIAMWIAGQPLSVATHDRLHHAGRHQRRATAFSRSATTSTSCCTRARALAAT